MKKIFALLICFMFMGVVNAEKCTVVTGDGSHLGDEIKCGTEHFYVMKRDNDKTELLAKYNLLAGDKIDAFTVTEEDYNSIIDGEDESEFCERLAIDRGYDPYYVYFVYGKDKCRVYEKLSSEHIRQDEKAKGTYIANNDSVLPIYGIGYLVPEWGYDAIVNGITHPNTYDNDGNLVIEGSSFEEYLTGYETELKSQGINVVSVGMPVLNKLLDFLEEISGREVESNFDYDPGYNDPNSPYFYVEKMDIKEYIPEQYSWLYDRAYWLGSGYYEQDSIGDYYISNEGYLCLMNRGECLYFSYPTGNGIRPLVTISSSNIAFVVETKTDGHGEIKAEKIQAREGEVIKFTITPAPGYVLGAVKVTDSNGNVLTFTNNTFTMPNANVLIEATFLPANPKTSDIAILAIASLAVISGVILLTHTRKLDELK